MDSYRKHKIIAYLNIKIFIGTMTLYLNMLFL